LFQVYIWGLFWFVIYLGLWDDLLRTYILSGILIMLDQLHLDWKIWNLFFFLISLELIMLVFGS